MRTIRSSSRFLGEGVSAEGRVSAWGEGVSAWEVSAQRGVCPGVVVVVYPSMHWGRHPPVNIMTDRHV